MSHSFNGYRVAANSTNAATEFELGPLVFDAIVGMRIYAIRQEINVSTNIGTDRNLERNNTVVTPMVSSRLRWNLYNLNIGVSVNNLFNNVNYNPPVGNLASSRFGQFTSIGGSFGGFGGGGFGGGGGSTNRRVELSARFSW
ncbi:hypothetical protein [Leptolyngbya sp. 7M]|uniref:hypothetical protein n=1 Tax=Leptolyngbya sp. 7M TaxID=2812896 RepID=UPI001B8BDA40|nr:hypothetical protein [Leptolyngbya sp. 7M]QYO67890.1 hypothetical protein JVX88_14565 [Leptolyngbya sp. 7M]